MKHAKQITCLLLFAVFAFHGLCRAEENPPVEVKRLSDRATVFKIEGGDSNIVVLNSRQGIVVVDTDVSPAFAVLLRQKIVETFGRKDFAYVINTHSHGDHTYGNQVFLDAMIIGHENCRDEMTKNSERLNLTVNRLKAGLSQMKEASAKMEPESEKAQAMAWRIAYYETFLRGREDGFVLTFPSVTFSDELTLCLGDLDLELKYFGLAHSASDIIIHCPQEGLWMTGDLFAPAVNLYIDSERVPELPRWVTGLEKILQTGKETRFIVPGHGAFLGGEELEKILADVRAKQEEFAGKESAFAEFKKAFEEQGIDVGLRILKDLKARPEKYYTLHPEIDQFAYRLMLDEKLDEALSIFLVLAELFPDSYIAFDSLGEVYSRKGKKELAIQNFKKSLELNPDNQNAVRQLESLKEKK